MNKGFQYFPEKLYSKPVRMTNIPAMKFFAMSKPQEIFYSVIDDLWNIITTWETVSGRGGKLPSATDDVYVRQVVTANLTTAINNLFVSGTMLSSGSIIFTINGNIQASGTLNFSSAINLFLLGINNYINPLLFSCGSSSTITYARNGDQDILDLTYRNISTSGTGYKNPTNNLSPLGILTIGINTSIELAGYNLTVNGTSSITGTLYKSSPGNILFIGLVNFGNTITPLLRFAAGNPNVEFRGGITMTNNGSTAIDTGTGNWTFTTNNQSITSLGNDVIYFNCPVIISGAITLTLTGYSSNTQDFIQINNTFDGNNAGSTLVNKGALNINATTHPMATGVFDYSSFANSIGYVYAGSHTLPGTSYSGLYIGNIGIKTLAANTTVSANLIIGSGNSSTLECSAYDLIVSGFTNLGNSSNSVAKISKNGSGSVLFTGLVTIFNSNLGAIDFTGNPSVELRGGMSFQNNTGIALNTGTGIWTFSTNNQSIANNFVTLTFDCPILISGAITLTLSFTTTAPNLTFTGTIDGNNAASTLDNRCTNAINYQSATMPMVTGILNCNSAANVFKYNRAGNQDVKGGITYRTLEFGGSGVKKLLGNVVVNTTAGGSWSITGTATIDYNGFSISTI